MRNAFALLGLMSFIVIFGVYLAFSKPVEAPIEVVMTTESDTKDSVLVEEPAVEEKVVEKPEPTDTQPEIIKVTDSTMALTLTSPVFEEGGNIPSKYTCDGENISPELHIGSAPEGTKSFVLVMDDPDIPQSVKDARGIEAFDHWVLYNIPEDTTVLKEGTSEIGMKGLNSSGRSGYTGPCPPDGKHRYIFRLYALPSTVVFEQIPTLRDVESAVKNTALDSVTLIGTYTR